MATKHLPSIVPPAQLAQAIASDPEIRLLDVRTESEFARVHLAGSHNVPLDRLEGYAQEIGSVRAPVVLVCRSGARAHSAQEILHRAGMRRLHLLDGGLLAWRAQGLPVERVPLSAGEMLRRAAGVLGLVLAALNFRANPLLAVVFAFVGLRLAMGQSILPCAVAGSCAVPGRDTDSNVRSLVEGTRAA